MQLRATFNFFLFIINPLHEFITSQNQSWIAMKEGQKKLKALLKLAKPIAYVILLLFTYTLGYLSSPPTPLPSSSSVTSFHDLQLDHFRVTTHCADPVPSQLVRQTILDHVFNSTSPFINFPPPHVTKLLRAKRVQGWGSNGAVFEHLIKKVKPRTIIEVGTFLGASAIHMVNLTRTLNLRTQILCVDDFRGWPGFQLHQFKDIKMINGDVLLMYQFMQNIVSANATESVLPIPFSSGSVLDKLCQWGVFGDLIEVDAGHDFHSAWSDINRAYRILQPGGVLFGHDYFTAADDRGVRRAVTLFAKLYGLKIKLDGQHWLIHSA